MKRRCVTFILFNYLLNIRCQALCNVDVIFFFIQIRVFLTAGVSATDGLQCRDAAVGSFIRNYSSEELQVDNPLEQRIQMPFGNRLSRFFGFKIRILVALISKARIQSSEEILISAQAQTTVE